MQALKTFHNLYSTMANERQSTHWTFAEGLLGLPKELRELVYAEVFKDLEPVPLENADTSSAVQALLALDGHPPNRTFEEEVLKACCIYSSFIVRFLDHQDYSCNVMRGDVRCSCTVLWLPQPQHCRHIRNLIIHTQEAGLDLGRSQVDTLEDTEAMHSGSHFRRCWEQVLEFPRLEQLTIKLEKSNNDQLSWVSFTPTLSVLRERSPKLRVSLSVSFDGLLESYWSDPIWENATEPGNVIEYPYDPMGFADVTELIEAPTGEDFAYVEEHCPREFRTRGQDILRGLLDETASQRRALAMHYVVKEPALLRVRIKEHYEVYKSMQLEEINQTIVVSQS
ncbi:uncharacterized protein M421DRAFT_165580 [Didymella exigua CBS 183.55]|uniref:SWIM-type domain-containing protein n=1 Tax=Didymella exigua CBS 183.55 TaxID=1150837 RepID=A0A6A5RI32_9PLEO|nr:uncharacterized protein M421DRAFT_165580 [Didymella exigua CBS 183.55]KAF1927991.1 hypothetical protein M421DRAFT_165580 [Didymella exigua CBS 183.55]